MKTGNEMIGLQNFNNYAEEILEHLDEGCQLIGADWRYLYLNAAAERHARRGRDELVGRTMMEVFPGIEETEMFRNLAACMKGRSAASMENRFIYPDGSNASFHLSFQPVSLGVLILSIDVSEREVAEGKLLESEERFSTVFRASPVGIGISRLADGKFIDINDAFLEIYGFERQEIIGHTSEEMNLWVDPEYRNRVVATLRAKGSVRNMEMTCRRKSGETGDLLFSAERIQLTGEDCFLGMIIDITQKKRIEETLRRQDMRYRAVVEDQTEIICRLLADGTYIFVNDVFCRFFGKTEEELLGNKWQPNAVAEDIAMIEERLATLSPANPVVIIENRVYSGSGEIRWLQFVNRGFYDQRGHLLETQAVGRDITERKKVEHELLLTKHCLDTASISIYIISGDDRILWVNDHACKSLGYSRKELRAMSTPDIDPVISSAMIAGLRRKVKEQGTVIFETLHQRKDGSRLPVEIRTNNLEYEGEDIAIWFVQDISERKRADQDLVERQRTIKAMAMELSVAEERERCRIAEELHDQVAPKLLLGKMRIHSLAELLPAGVGADAIASVTAMIDQSISDIRSLTFQLRPPILANVGLEAALKWLAQEFGEHYGLVVNIADDKSFKPLKYEIRSAIFQVVRELLLNVVKHAGTQNAWITIKRSKDMIDIKVEDDGCGADPASFYCDKPKPGGFGIFNTKSKIEFLGGEMLFDSSPGSGTRVFIRAPLDTTSTEGR